MIDFRSDTVTRPTAEMWEQMRVATLLDDTLEGDPTVRHLEMRTAELTGKQDALFVVSGTMGNVIATLAHARERGEALVDEQSHIALSEAGGLSHLAGLFCVRIPSHKGEMQIDVLRESIRPSFSRYGLPTAMIAMETSHNHSGGYVPSLPYMQQVAALARSANVPVHIDGARAFNAAIALGVSIATISAHGDSISLCLSKGLSAPMGSVLAGTAEFIQRARVFRRMVGGGLRQAGIMAAAGLVALDNMTVRLADDHRRAHRLWELLHAIDPALVNADAPHTNILHLHAEGGDAYAWEKKLAERGILARAVNRRSLRLVTHRHIGDADIDAVQRAIFEMRDGDQTR